MIDEYVADAIKVIQHNAAYDERQRISKAIRTEAQRYRDADDIGGIGIAVSRFLADLAERIDRGAL